MHLHLLVVLSRLDVYSASNIQNAVTNPSPKPNLADPLGILDTYLQGADVKGAQTAFQADQSALAKAKATAQSRQLAIEGNPLESQQYIVGAQSRAGQLDSAKLAALSDAAGVSQSAYLAAKDFATQKANIALSERNTLTNLIANNPGAKITYSDTPETAATKIQKYTDTVKAQNEKDAYKKQLKDLYLQYTGSSAKPMSTSALEKKVKTAAKKASASKDALDALDLAIKKKSLAGSGSGTSADDKQVAAFQSDIGKQRATLEKQSTAKNTDLTSWSKAWNYINSKYPGLDPNTIDAALGLDYRKKFEGK